MFIVIQKLKQTHQARLGRDNQLHNLIIISYLKTINYLFNCSETEIPRNYALSSSKKSNSEVKYLVKIKKESEGFMPNMLQG